MTCIALSKEELAAASSDALRHMAVHARLALLRSKAELAAMETVFPEGGVLVMMAQQQVEMWANAATLLQAAHEVKSGGH